nr:adenosylcobalamin-dependent ribonucleoside-diphosphate reductase [bacterium]
MDSFSIEGMFEYKGKLTGLVKKQLLRAYRDLYFYLRDQREKGNLPVSQVEYLADDELANNIYKNKYYLRDSQGELLEFRPEDVFLRIAAFVAAVENDTETRRRWGKAFYNDLYESHFLPGGRVMAGAGDLYRLKTLANCFATVIEHDDIESIYDAAYECARTYSYGGGIGVDMTPLRPRNSIVHNASDSSTGSVSFMELFSLTTGLIGQSGRRGALMLTIDVKHPDVLDFIDVKKKPNWVTAQIIEQARWSKQFNDAQLAELEKMVAENTQVRFANTSVKVTDEFMQAVEEQNRFGQRRVLLYRKLDRALLKSAPQTAELHYSQGIPSRDVRQYQLLQDFAGLEELNSWLLEEHGVEVSGDTLRDIDQRDVYGDFVLQLNSSDHDLAIRYSGDFMLYYASENTGEIRHLIKARTIWNSFVESNYRSAEPGLMFWSHMTRMSPSNYVGRPIVSTNPCAEIPLEDGGACNLAALNLSRFVKNGFDAKAEIDWQQLELVASHVIRFLDNVVSWNQILNPLEKQRRAALETRRLGMGVMGIADMFFQLGIGYDSEEGVELIDKIMNFIANAAYSTSAHLASEKSSSEIFDYENYIKNPFFQNSLTAETQELIRDRGLRNIALLTIAPTGTISNIALSYQGADRNYVGVSGGVEPVFALYYVRRSESFNNRKFKIFHSTVQAYIDRNQLGDKIAFTENNDELKALLPDYFFRTAHEVTSARRVEIQGVCQRSV